jgi:peptidoglycan L-alanyl-D-glutamate endopeptidase CwlK
MSQEINRELSKIDPKLVEYFNSLSKIIKETSGKDFRIFEGNRTLERQQVLIKQGFSKTLKSNHLHIPSKAIDIIEFPWSWKGFILTPEYKKLVNTHLKNFPDIAWGGNWKKFVDLPHHELKK